MRFLLPRDVDEVRQVEGREAGGPPGRAVAPRLPVPPLAIKYLQAVLPVPLTRCGQGPALEVAVHGARPAFRPQVVAGLNEEGPAWTGRGGPGPATEVDTVTFLGTRRR